MDNSGLRRLKEGDSLEINGERFTVVSVRAMDDAGELKKEKEERDEGIEFELRNEEGSTCSLTLMDTVAEYELVAVLDGPAPLNPNPDIVFVQDMERNRTYKYSVRKRPKDPAGLRFIKGDAEARVDSIRPT